MYPGGCGGPYLSERQWGTVREDYSEFGDAWNYFPRDQARSRAYRWGEDGLAGISDEKQRLCFALALWNGKDPILKERLFGLTNGEGNHAYEAAYAFLWTDEHGEPLNGRHRYLLHFDELPPAEAFWSLTMYDAHNFYLVANPINRYSIGDRTPGIQYNDDGSLDLYLQHDSPGPDKESNWLPSPAGDFRPTLRMYQPGAGVFEGSWLPPSIRRLD